MAYTDMGEPTRDRVLRLADALFARRGYAAVSMRDVALAAGVTKPALYYHFRDKDALFTECLLVHQLQLGERLRAALDDDEPVASRAAAAAEVILTGAAHNPARTRSDVVEHLSETERHRIDVSFADNIMQPLVRLFDEARVAGSLRAGVDPQVVAVALVAVCTASLPGLNGTDTLNPDVAAALAGQVADLVLNGSLA